MIEIGDYLDSSYLNLIHSDIEELLNVHNIIEGTFNTIGKDLKRDAESANSVHYLEHLLGLLVAAEERFPNLVRRSLFVAVYGFLESELTRLCSTLWLLERQSPNDKIRRWHLKTSVDYLRERIDLPEMLASDRERWFLSTLRNGCAHHQAFFDLDDLDKMKEYLEVFQAYPGIVIDAHHETVSIQDNFLPALLGRVRSTLDELVETLVEYGGQKGLSVKFEVIQRLAKELLEKKRGDHKST